MRKTNQTISRWSLKIEQQSIVRKKENRRTVLRNLDNSFLRIGKLFTLKSIELNWSSDIDLLSSKKNSVDTNIREFDPGSGWTLAACITHSSRTKKVGACSDRISGGRVSNAWVTCLQEGDNNGKLLLIPHKSWWPHGRHGKEKSLADGLASD